MPQKMGGVILTNWDDPPSITIFARQKIAPDVPLARGWLIAGKTGRETCTKQQHTTLMANGKPRRFQTTWDSSKTLVNI